jgi:hypothetical protein
VITIYLTANKGKQLIENPQTKAGAKCFIIIKSKVQGLNFHFLFTVAHVFCVPLRHVKL